MIGVRFKNYTVYNGALASGQCCDDANQTAPGCQPNQCDVAFDPCGKRVSSATCDVFPKSMLPTTYNSSSFQFQDKIGNGIKQSASLLVFKTPYKPENISLTFMAYDMPDNETATDPKALIATWNYEIDWLDPKYEDAQAKWRDLILTDIQAELGLQVLSQCVRHYYGPRCHIYCADACAYTCSDTGTKIPTGANCSVPFPGTMSNITNSTGNYTGGSDRDDPLDIIIPLLIGLGCGIALVLLLILLSYLIWRCLKKREPGGKKDKKSKKKSPKSSKKDSSELKRTSDTVTKNKSKGIAIATTAYQNEASVINNAKPSKRTNRRVAPTRAFPNGGIRTAAPAAAATTPSLSGYYGFD